MLENKHIEYKQQVTPELEKEVVAFLNSNEGGINYIGIDKTGDPVGVKDADHDQLLIKDRLKNNILPSCMGLFDLVTERKKKRISSSLLLLEVMKNRIILKDMVCQKRVLLLE